VRIRMMGGSVPTDKLLDALGVPFVIVPLVNNDNNQHSSDENLRIGHLLSGTRTFTGLLRRRSESSGSSGPLRARSSHATLPRPLTEPYSGGVTLSTAGSGGRVMSARSLLDPIAQFVSPAGATLMPPLPPRSMNWCTAPEALASSTIR